MSLSINELPVELLLTIIDHLDDTKTLESLALVSHHFYRVTQPLIATGYRRYGALAPLYTDLDNEYLVDEDDEMDGTTGVLGPGLRPWLAHLLEQPRRATFTRALQLKDWRDDRRRPDNEDVAPFLPYEEADKQLLVHLLATGETDPSLHNDHVYLYTHDLLIILMSLSRNLRWLESVSTSDVRKLEPFLWRATGLGAYKDKYLYLNQLKEVRLEWGTEKYSLNESTLMPFYFMPSVRIITAINVSNESMADLPPDMGLDLSELRGLSRLEELNLYRCNMDGYGLVTTLGFMHSSLKRLSWWWGDSNISYDMYLPRPVSKALFEVRDSLEVLCMHNFTQDYDASLDDDDDSLDQRLTSIRSFTRLHELSIEVWQLLGWNWDDVNSNQVSADGAPAPTLHETLPASLHILKLEWYSTSSDENLASIVKRHLEDLLRVRNEVLPNLKEIQVECRAEWEESLAPVRTQSEALGIKMSFGRIKHKVDIDWEAIADEMRGTTV